MSKKMGEITVKHDGKDYRLCLTNRAIGVLQDEFGREMEALMPPDGSVPHFGAIVRAVELALVKHHPDDGGADLADEMLGPDRKLFGELLEVTFPEMKTGKAGKKPNPAKQTT